ncbi:MAG: HAD-IIB family hydrolase [Thermoanaerobaculia bacterium]
MTEGLYLLHLSVHGLVRGAAPELGRDADTGGQVGYVLELVRALARSPEVARVDLLTRLVEDPAAGADYAAPEEALANRARIVRLPFGPKRYLRKELLWPHLPALVDRCVEFLRAQERLPHLIHTHYADAGYVGVRLSQLLGIPLVHTGHSLGLTKLSRLLASGRAESNLERQFRFSSRIAAEEEILENARLVLASTRQEVDGQWGEYENFRPGRFAVVPPGVDTSRFAPPVPSRARTSSPAIDRWLRDPRKPLVLAVSRPAPKKNLPTLVEAFGRDPELRRRANLAIFAGVREDVATAEEEARAVYTELLLAADRHDLWGSIALPKRHAPEDVPGIYRTAASRRGLFVNAALTEPFGLTLLEAAASGLPVVATADGGPREILANCRNGLLVDPRDVEALSRALREALSDPSRWSQWARNGLRRVHDTYSWDGHVERYLALCTKLLRRERKSLRRRHAALRTSPLARLADASFLLVTDIDDTLVGDEEALERLLAWRKANAPRVAFGVATGRSFPRTLEILSAWKVPLPDVLVTAVGTEIRFASDLKPDRAWESHIRHGWRRDEVVRALSSAAGLKKQPEANDGPYKASWDVVPGRSVDLDAIRRQLRSRGLAARLVFSQGKFLDVLPVRASKGLAVRFLALRLGLPLESFLVAGDSGNDLEMLVGDTMAVVVGNHKPELEELRGRDRVYFASAPFAGGILEGIASYRFAAERPC